MLTINICFDRLVRQDASTIDINLISNCHIITQDCDVLQPSPFTDDTVPADNGALDPSMILDLTVGQDDTTLQSDTIANHDTGSNGDIRTNAAVLANLSGRVNHDISAVYIWLGGWDECFRVAFVQGGKVEASAAEEVFWLTNIHPETLEVE